MARLIKLKDREEMLKTKKKLRHLLTFDRVIAILQLLVFIYIATKH